MLNRRTLIAHGMLAAGAAVAAPALASLPAALPSRGPFRGRLGKLQVLQVGVGGSIAPPTGTS